MLVHGGGSTARFWDRLLPFLDRPALAVDLPGRNGKPADLDSLTVDDEVAAVVEDVLQAGLEGPLTLVAHSSGGLVVPGVVAALADRDGPAAGPAVGPVTRIVLSAALVPEEGGCGIDCMKPKHREGLVWALEQARKDGTSIRTAGPPADAESFRHAYGGDPLDDDTLAYMVDPVRCVADTVHHYFQPVRWSMAGSVPVTYLLNERDRPVPSATQEEMVTRLPSCVVVRLDCGHLPAVTEPERFATLLG